MQEPTPSDTERLLTQADVADRLGVSVGWVREHTNAGRLAAVRLPGAGKRPLVRYRPETIQALIKAWETPSPAGSPNPYGRKRRGRAA